MLLLRAKTLAMSYITDYYAASYAALRSRARYRHAAPLITPRRADDDMPPADAASAMSALTR